MTQHHASPAAPERRTIPGPRGRELWQVAFQFTKRPHECLAELVHKYGDIVSLHYPLEKVVLLARPEYVEHVLHHRHANYTKQTGRWTTLRQIWGDGLLTAEGEVWVQQRQRMQSAFHQDRMEQFAAMAIEEVQRTSREWATSSARGEPREVYRDMLHCTVRALARAMFGSSIEDKTDRIISAVNTINGYVNPISLASLLNLPLSVRRWIVPGSREYQAALNSVRTIFDELIRRRLESGAEDHDLLGLIMRGIDEETSQTMSVEQLHDEMMTLLMAGHEPTAIAAAWSWYWLSQCPEAERQLHAEVDGVLAGRPPAYDDLPRLPYTKMVFQEALRLSPPIWGYDRKAIADDVIDGYLIRRGTNVAISPYVVHHHPKYWEHPEAFNPRRFLPDEVARRPVYAFFPFGGGPRRCIGFRFALLHGQLILATLAQSFSVQLKPGHPVVPLPRLNFPPKFGIQAIVHPRRACGAAPTAKA